MKTRLTGEELKMAHSGLCGVSIGDDGDCSCLVHWVEGLQKEADAANLQVEGARKLLERAKTTIYEVFAEALIIDGGHDVVVQGKEGELLAEIDAHLKGMEKRKCDCSAKTGYATEHLPGCNQ